MTGSARALNDVFTTDAGNMSKLVRTILVLGAALGLLVGGGTALVVARSITRPLAGLQRDMLALARDPAAGSVSFCLSSGGILRSTRWGGIVR